MKIPAIILLSFTIISSSLVSVGVTAQSATADSKTPHYCGTKKTGRLIPDKPFGFDFSGACRAHDNCLDRGGNDKECLSVFKDELNSVCLNLPSGRNNKLSIFTPNDKYRGCLIAASSYASAVKASIGIKKLNKIKVTFPD